MVTSRIKIVCPQCGATLGAKPSAVGRSVKCPKCKHCIAVRHEQREVGIQASVAVQTRSAPPVRKPRRLNSMDSSLREERIFFRLVGLLVAASALLTFGFAIGQHYTMSQVEITREAGMKLQFVRNRGVKRLFDSLASKPNVLQSAEK